jgi:hypothetical protein
MVLREATAQSEPADAGSSSNSAAEASFRTWRAGVLD